MSGPITKAFNPDDRADASRLAGCTGCGSRYTCNSTRHAIAISPAQHVDMVIEIATGDERRDMTTHRRVIGALLFAVVSAATTLAGAQQLAKPTDDLTKAVVLVAKPELSDPIYGETVLIVMPLNGDRHVGFIVNRPTEVTLGKLFPGASAAQKVVDPVYLGGPMATQVLFALVQRSDSPSKASLELMPGLYAAADVATVDGITRFESDHARFVAGFVAWTPGELRDEIERGAWYVLEASPALALRKPDGLWEELVQSAHRAEKTI